MHIVYITSEYPQANIPHGGVGTFVQTIARELVKQNISVSVVGINNSNEDKQFEDQGVFIYLLPKSKLRVVGGLINYHSINKKLRDIHKNKLVSVVESTELSLAFIHKLPEVKYLIRLHGGHHFFAESENRGVNWWKGFQEKRSFRNADAFVAVSKFVKDHTEKYLSYQNKKIQIIFYPINFELFKPKLNIDEDSFKIVFAGTICEKKGVKQLIEAFINVKNKYPKLTLELYGRDWKFKNGNSYIEFIKSTFSKEDLNGISFLGSIEHKDLPLKFQKATICVFPSHMETLGLVAPEAMAMEKAVVFTEKGPGREVIDHNISGLLCDPLNPTDIAKQILFLLDNNESRISLGINARKKALKMFSSELIIQENIEFYKSII
jgi:glycosyltransferase involved in cell wall biosynthesis